MNVLARYRDWGLLVACNLIWGSQFVIYKIVAQQVGPVFATLLPTACATFLLIPIVRYEKRRGDTVCHRGRVPARDVWQYLLIGICGQVVVQLFVAWGVRFTLAANAALLMLALPIATAFMAYLFLGERMTVIRWIGFVLAIAGVIECSGIRWGELNMTGSRFLVGNAMIFCAINGSAFYNAYSKRLLRRYSPLQVLLYSYYVVVIFMLPIAIYTEPTIFRSIENLRPAVWVGLLLLAVFQDFLAMIIFLNVLTRLDATQAGLSNYLITVFGVLIAAMVLHEHMTKFMAIGGMLVLASTLLVTVHEGRQRSLAVPDIPTHGIGR